MIDTFSQKQLQSFWLCLVTLSFFLKVSWWQIETFNETFNWKFQKCVVLWQNVNYLFRAWNCDWFLIKSSVLFDNKSIINWKLRVNWIKILLIQFNCNQNAIVFTMMKYIKLKEKKQMLKANQNIYKKAHCKKA